jgi:DNA-binding protein H-NS
MSETIEVLEEETLEAIEKKMAALQVKKQAILDTKRKGVLAETRKNIALYGFTAKELRLEEAEPVEKTEKPVKVVKPITFRDGATGNEWSGTLQQKGRKPLWIKEAVENGTIEQYRV